MDFVQIIDNRLKELTLKKENMETAVRSPQYHVKRTEDMVTEVLVQLRALDLNKKELMDEIASILEQLPTFIKAGWMNVSSGVYAIDEDLTRWKEFKGVYEDWSSKQLEAKALLDSTEIEEPSKMTSIRRKIGTRPPITLRRYRNGTNELESDEESEA